MVVGLHGWYLGHGGRCLRSCAQYHIWIWKANCRQPSLMNKEFLFLNDFDICRNHIMSALTVKFKYWSLAPWHICGIGHPDASVARCCAAECLRQFEQRPEAKYHHRLTNKLLGPGTSLRQQIELMIGGKPLAELPELQWEILLLKCCPVVERIIESRHSMVKSCLGSKRRKHETTVSLACRLPELKVRLSIQTFSQSWASLRSRFGIRSKYVSCLVSLDTPPSPCLLRVADTLPSSLNLLFNCFTALMLR